VIYAGSYPFLFEKLTDTVKNIRKVNPESRLTFIISSNNMRRAIKEYLSDSLGLLYNAEFFTKLDIARELTGKEPINNLEKEILIDSILKEKDIHIEGLSRAYSETIQKLKESKIEPQDLPEGERLKEVYEEYQRKLADLNLKDREDIITEASLKDYKTDFLFVFGFHSLTEIDRDMFRSLLKNRSSVYIPINPGYSVFEKNPYLRSTFEFFKNFRLKTYTESIKKEDQKLTSLMFSSAITEEGIGCKNIKFIVSKGKRDEIVKIAKSILKIKENTRWYKIGVVINDLGSYLKDIKSVFQEYNIPYYLSEENRFIDQLPFKKMFLLFSLKENNFSKIDLLNSISKEILNIDDIDISSFEKDLIENSYEEGYESIIKLLSDKGYNGIIDLLRSIKKIPERGSLNDLIQNYTDIIERFFKKNEHTEKFLNILENIQLNHVLKKLYPEITYSEFNSILLHYLEEEDIDRRLKGDIVQIRTPNISEGIIFDYLFFVDMNEGKYPSIIKDDPVINNTLRVKLEEKGLPKLNASYWQQIITFISIFNSSKNIYISYKNRDDKGNDLSPSVLVEELLRLNYGRSYFENGDTLKLEDPEEITTLKEFRLKNAAHLINTDNLLKKVVEAHIKRESEYITEYEGYVNVNPKYIKLTPSKLQTFSDCPYRFFLSSVINPDTFEIVDTERIPPDKEGTAIHEILEFVYRKRIKDKSRLRMIIPALVKEKFRPLLEELKPSARIFEEKRVLLLSDILTEFVIKDLERIRNIYIPEVL